MYLLFPPFEFLGIVHSGLVVGRKEVVQKASDGLGDQTDLEGIEGKGLIQGWEQIFWSNPHYGIHGWDTHVDGYESIVEIPQWFGQ